ncbi:MAG: biopolymer transporter ExbD [Gammaproteobacteria bacterium]|nr:MAG: biopolymer transporter ExbD [Gammaproteobacteria bacterium]
MSMNISEGESSELNSTINTTPLVDIMLVLLIVFLIAVPVVLKTVPVELPNVSNIPTQSKPENIVISVDAEGETYWNNVVITKEEMLAKLRIEAPKKPQPEVHIRGDKSARYEPVGRVVAYCQKAGIVRVGFITAPEHI